MYIKNKKKNCSYNLLEILLLAINGTAACNMREMLNCSMPALRKLKSFLYFMLYSYFTSLKIVLITQFVFMVNIPSHHFRLG